MAIKNLSDKLDKREQLIWVGVCVWVRACGFAQLMNFYLSEKTCTMKIFTGFEACQFHVGHDDHGSVLRGTPMFAS